MEKLITANASIVPITDLSYEGRGIAHINGKITFVQDALPDESVLIQTTKKHRQYDEAKAVEILISSPNRVEPKCIHYGICGGCCLQHLNAETQLQHKQKVLLAQLKHIARTEPETMLPPLKAKNWGYRRSARLGVKYVTKKKAVLVGFRERNGRYLAQLQTCETLDPKIGQLILPLQRLISSLKAYQLIPQIQASLGDQVLALVFRHLAPFDTQDIEKLKIFAQAYQLQIYLQPGNESTTQCIWPEKPRPLSYRINEGKLLTKPLAILFEPCHFIQINAAINQSMIDCAMELLAPNYRDQILDLFCGLGNFSLPLATRCQTVVGVEGASELVKYAKINAIHNDISNVEFHTADLSTSIEKEAWSRKPFNKLLLDPPRSGAFEIIQQISSWQQIERIVYVSCNSVTLARDAAELMKKGYRLANAGILNMFPQTHHSEAICLFTK